MAHQPSTYPILSRVPGLLFELIAAGSLSSGLCFRTSVANGSKVIASKTFDNCGEGLKGKGQLLLPQGKFQQILMARLAALENKALVLTGSSLTSFTQHATHVSVTYSTPTGDPQTVSAAYLIGADGSHSPVRKTLALPFPGETLDAHLVATDIYFDFAAHAFHDANFIIDPENYGLIGRINHTGLWRVSYGVPSSMHDEEITQTVHDKLSLMLPNAGLDKNGERAYKVARIAPYKAQQRLAPTLHSNRVCLVGDAAHLTNPYAGLGLASGIADASSLAEILDRILTHQAGNAEELLNAWSAARHQKFLDAVDGPSRMAYKRVRSDVSSDEKFGELAGRDPMVGALREGMPVVPPSLETRGEELEGW